MRAAKQQATDLDHIEKVFDGMVAPGSTTTGDETQSKEEAPSKSSNVKPRPIRTDNLARFAEPPAPPPQQPLPEKPDSAKSTSLNSLSLSSLLKRTDTAKPGSNGSSPTNGSQNSMLQLVEALSQARKELETHSIRVKELEDMLNEERSARAEAEERARKLEQSAAARPVTQVEEVSEPEDIQTPVSQPERSVTPEKENIESESDLQKRLDLMVAEMQKMKVDMDKFKRRAETAEEDATKTRESLAEMIQRLRQENSDEGNSDLANGKKSRLTSAGASSDMAEEGSTTIKHAANGHVRTPRLPVHLEQAVATVLRQSSSGNTSEGLAQSAPYVSMLGVVLIGVGMMAYLNSWQKTDK
jgi:hypothetical protein